MAKSERKGNKEIRKPKQPKAPPKVASTFGSQIKLAETAGAPKGNLNALRTGRLPARCTVALLDPPRQDGGA